MSLQLGDGHRTGVVQPVGHHGGLSFEVNDPLYWDGYVGEGVEGSGQRLHAGTEVAVGPLDVVNRVEVLVLEQRALGAALLAINLDQVGLPSPFYPSPGDQRAAARPPELAPAGWEASRRRR